MMQKKSLALALASMSFAMITRPNSGPPTYIYPKQTKEKPWGKRNRRKINGMKGGAK